MYWQKRKDRTGKEYFSVIYYDPTEKTNKRLPKEDTWFLCTEAEADAFVKNKSMEIEALKLRIEKKLAWQKKYHDFENELLPLYEIERKKEAPGSWQGSLYYVRHYVLHFFLNQKDCNNPLNWSLYFQEFKDFLLTTKTAKGGRSLAYNTRNHCIIALNTFIECIAKKSKLSGVVEKCDLFPEYLMNKRTIEDLYLDHEIESIKRSLVEINESSHDFFVLLARTGMRINEARGVSLDDLLKGNIPDLNIHKTLCAFGISTKAFIHLSSQPSTHRKKTEIRDINGSVQRKPLKGKDKVLKEAQSRFIPIWTSDLISILKKRREIQIELFKIKKFGQKKSDYLLFEDVKTSTFERDLAKACSMNQLRYRSPHCLRHSFATKIAGILFGHHAIISQILGHTKLETTEGYIHLSALLNKEIQLKRQINDDDWGDI